MPSIDSVLHQLLGSTGNKFSPIQLLAERIEFVEPEHKDSYMEHLRLKYTPINAVIKLSNSQQKSSGAEMYSKVNIQVHWTHKQNIGCGLVNLSNTCYLNSTLQCLLYTPPLINYLILDHKEHCRSHNFCVGCSLLQLYNTVNNSNSGACRPSAFIHHLKLIAKHFCYGRQEDAHEFLVHLRDKMIQQFIHSYPRTDNARKETTPTHAIFGGRLMSTVTCSLCYFQSHTSECFLGLGLDVRHSETIQQSFNKLCKKETLSGTDSYKCEKCNRTVIATKQFKIEQTPNVLVLHLKRFQFGGFIGKLKNQIRFPEHLDIDNWTSKKGDKANNTTYSLYAVLVHAGSSAQCGHYYSFVKSATGAWHCMNDTSVSTVSLQRVLNSEAYLLFYVRNEGRQNGGPATSAANGSHVPNKPNGHVTTKPNVKLMDTDPFYSEPTPKPSVLTSKAPLKFNVLNKSKLIKNPLLTANSFMKGSKSSDTKNFIGPLLPNGNTASKKESDFQNRQKSVKSTDGTLISCTTSLSSLDIIKSSYEDRDSEAEEAPPPPLRVNAQPVLMLRKKKRQSSGSDKPTSNNIFDKLAQNTAVKGWDGKASKSFSNSSWDSIANPFKRERDEYDAELDQGRTKKVKHQKFEQKRDKNAFQKHLDYQKQKVYKPWDNEKRHSNHGNGFNKSPNHFWKNRKHNS